MPRFFLPSDFILTDPAVLPKNILLEGEDAFHLSVSLRARIGDAVTVCTCDAVEIECEIVSICGGKKNPVVTLLPLSARPSEQESPCRITVYQAMPKGKKIDSVIQKCTELGASRIVIVYSDYSIPQEEGKQQKLDRYRKIAIEAAKQCGRAKQVEISVCPCVEDAIEQMKKDSLSFVCYEKESHGSLKKLLRESCSGTLSFFIGPEGGISERELLLFSQADVPTVTLGKRILRTETAASCVLSMILYEKEL